MIKKILIDMEKYRSVEGRNSDIPLPEGMFRRKGEQPGLISLREWASFQFSCRRCSAAPCMEVCPAEALEKDGSRMIVRSPNLCISCKSCVVICPFGTLMNDCFSFHRDLSNEYDLSDEKELELWISRAPDGAVSFSEEEEDPEKHIYKLTDHILVRERRWKSQIP